MRSLLCSGPLSGVNEIAEQAEIDELVDRDRI
jgi:hypothetical protein